MADGYELTVEDAPAEVDLQIVHNGLHEFNLARAGEEGFHRLAVFLRDGDGNVVGGVLGETFWRWLHVGVLWLREDLRGQGRGRALLTAAEEEAGRRGCLGAYLETTSFQARPFYEKMGYTVCGEVPDLPPGATFYVLRKVLRTSGDDETA